MALQPLAPAINPVRRHHAVRKFQKTLRKHTLLAVGCNHAVRKAQPRHDALHHIGANPFCRRLFGNARLEGFKPAIGRAALAIGRARHPQRDNRRGNQFHAPNNIHDIVHLS